MKSFAPARIEKAQAVNPQLRSFYRRERWERRNHLPQKQDGLSEGNWELQAPSAAPGLSPSGAGTESGPGFSRGSEERVKQSPSGHELLRCSAWQLLPQPRAGMVSPSPFPQWEGTSLQHPAETSDVTPLHESRFRVLLSKT